MGFAGAQLSYGADQMIEAWKIQMNPIYDFKGQVALVTGAAKGMGLATARMFAESGASVVLADIDGDLAAKEAERIVLEGGTAIGVACDVADEAQVPAMVDRAVAEYGRLDMAFNNAGIQVPPSDAANEPIEHFERVTAVNQRGVWACMKHELRVMREQGSGAIVNCSSLGGLVGLPQRAAYHGTKHAVLGMTKSAGVEYAPRGIRINAVCPGTIDTPMVADMLEGQADAMAEIMKQQSIGRLGRAEEVAAAVLWLCSPAASFVIGVGLPVDGGFTAH
jgi:NAD(P)-dependent dehydrogenase (short-subunit alcohol dehydrogenase family)